MLSLMMGYMRDCDRVPSYSSSALGERDITAILIALNRQRVDPA
jgi:hypothetical protein